MLGTTRLVMSLLLVTALSGCALMDEHLGEKDTLGELGAADRQRILGDRSDSRIGDPDNWTAPEDELAEEQGEDEEDLETAIYRGSGSFIDEDDAARGAEPVQVDPENGDTYLNFEDADIREVVRYVLGDVLEYNYIVDPQVKGGVTMATTRPLSREALLPTLEKVLRLNGATLIRSGEVYRVAALETSLQGTVAPSLVNGGGAGMNVRIVPLEYISAGAMMKILEPFMTPASVVRVDDRRNLLILAGTQRELANWLDTIEIFDVDWLEGMSVGLFPLENTNAEELAGEIDAITGGGTGGGGDDGEGGAAPMSGLFRMIPIERLNALLVVTRQPDYLEKVQVWVDRLDRGAAGSGAQLHVYRMQHGKAEDVASVLQQVYGSGGRQRTTSRDVSTAPGVGQSEIRSSDSTDSGSDNQRSTGVSSATLEGGDDSGLEGEVRIIADNANNALLILANRNDYNLVESAIRKLDIPPLQVLVDATIVEVSLTGSLQYGVQWFFKNNVGDYGGRGRFSSGDSAQIGQSFSGFNFSLVDNANQVRALLSALAEDSQVNVVSAPSIMVLDNQAAIIKVGDRVPVRVSESTSVVTDNPVTTSSIQYQDTGVILEVTPRVNASGMVTMEISQEVNDVSSTQTSSIDSPTIQQRLLESTVSVRSSDTIVLGGLIRETRSDGNAGVPGLRNLPLIGNLFSQTTMDSRRTELLVLLTPTVARNSEDARAITDEFRNRLQRLLPEEGLDEAQPQEDDTSTDDRAEPGRGDEGGPAGDAEELAEEHGDLWRDSVELAWPE